MMPSDDVEEAHFDKIGEEPGWSGEALKNLQCFKVGERGRIALSHASTFQTLHKGITAQQCRHVIEHDESVGPELAACSSVQIMMARGDHSSAQTEEDSVQHRCCLPYIQVAKAEPHGTACIPGGDQQRQVGFSGAATAREREPCQAI